MSLLVYINLCGTQRHTLALLQVKCNYAVSATFEGRPAFSRRLDSIVPRNLPQPKLCYKFMRSHEKVLRVESLTGPCWRTI